MTDGDLNALDLINQMNSSIKAELAPLTSKIDTLDNKVSELYKDRVTRNDLEKLSVAFVPRDAYEARHSQLIERDRDLENDIKEIRADILQRATATQARVDLIEKSVEVKLKDQQEMQLSVKDRSWIRAGQIMGALGLLGAALEFFLSHVHFQ